MAKRQNAYKMACKVQQYAWGKIGKNSTVAQFAETGDPSFKLDPASPYAELWMGAHPKAPSQISMVDGSTALLPDWLQDNKWALNEKVADHFGNRLPFLFKVLSINKALSIQAHPDKKRAVVCRAVDPAHYSDDNHKPEMAIALTPFEGLCGFRTMADLAGHLKAIPELKACVGAAADALVAAVEAGESEAGLKHALRDAFSALMRCDPATVKTQLESLVARLQAVSALTELEQLQLRLNAQYPGGDVGCFCIYFLNVVNMQPGDAIFLAANEPHAYLFGDCVECMATSDNVVRAGLTPKFKDVDRLCEMLTYSSRSGDEQIKRGEADPEDPNAKLYKNPVPEFDIACIKYSAGSTQPLRAIDGPSIFIVTQGSGTLGLTDAAEDGLETGMVYFVPAGATPTMTAGDAGLNVYRAFCDDTMVSECVAE